MQLLDLFLTSWLFEAFFAVSFLSSLKIPVFADYAEFLSRRTRVGADPKKFWDPL